MKDLKKAVCREDAPQTAFCQGYELCEEGIDRFLDRVAIRLAFEVPHDSAHELAGTALVRDAKLCCLRNDCGANVIIVHESGEEGFNHRELRRLGFCEVGAPALRELGDGVLALLDSSSHYVNAFFICQLLGREALLCDELVHEGCQEAAIRGEGNGVLGDHGFLDLVFDCVVHGTSIPHSFPPRIILPDALVYSFHMIDSWPFLAAVGVLLAVHAVFVWRSGKQEKRPGDDAGLQFLQTQMQDLARTVNDVSRLVDGRLVESSEKLNDALRHQSRESVAVIRDITERLTKLDETNRQVVSFADQLQSLQDILKNPKQRGILGEYYLETLLKNVLPPGSYTMQYPFPDGTIVDAVVRVRDALIPVDSKFSLENYNRFVEEKNPQERARLEKVFVGDLKIRIQETAKYIRPELGTTDFAFMFIPHEAIYYDLLVNKVGEMQGEDTESLIQRAANKYKVIIVSPTSFLAYLQTVLQGLKALRIEEEAKNILKQVDALGKHIKAFEEYHGKLGNALSTTVNHFNASRKELGKIDKDVVRMGAASPGIEPLLVDKPNLED